MQRLAVSNCAANAFSGSGEFSSVNKNVRNPAVLYPRYGGVMERADSGIQTVADLKGRKLAADCLKQ